MNFLPRSSYHRFPGMVGLAILIIFTGCEEDELSVAGQSPKTSCCVDWVQRIPGEADDRAKSNRHQFSRLFVTDDSGNIIVSRSLEKCVVVYSFDKTSGKATQLSRVALSEKWSEPSDAVLFSKQDLCILDLRKPQFAFYQAKEDGATYALTGIVEGPSKHFLLQPKRAVVHPNHKLIYATAEGSNQIWVISLEHKENPIAIQCLGADEVKPPRIRYDQVNTIDYPQGLVLSPDGKSLYVANGGHGLLHFRVSEEDGTLTLEKSYNRLTLPRNTAVQSVTHIDAVAVSRDGMRVYVAGVHANVSVFTRDAETGILSLAEIFNASLTLGLGEHSDLDVGSIRLSSDGQLIAVSCGKPGCVMLLTHGADGKLTVERIIRDSDSEEKSLTGVSDAVFSPDDRYLLVTSTDLILGVLRLQKAPDLDP